MKPMQTAVVAPVNRKASQMLGIKFAPAKMTRSNPVLSNPNLKLSKTKGLDDGKSSTSIFNRNG